MHPWQRKIVDQKVNHPWRPVPRWNSKRGCAGFWTSALAVRLALRSVLHRHGVSSLWRWCVGSVRFHEERTQTTDVLFPHPWADTFAGVRTPTPDPQKPMYLRGRILRVIGFQDSDEHMSWKWMSACHCPKRKTTVLDAEGVPSTSM